MVLLVPCRSITTCASRLNYILSCTFWSATALCLDICSHVSLVSPTWRQDNGCGPLPPIVWQYRQFVCLLSAGEPSQFPAPAHNDLPSHVTSSIVLHRHSRFSDSVSKHSHFPVHTRASSLGVQFLTASVDLAVGLDAVMRYLHINFYKKSYMLPEF